MRWLLKIGVCLGLASHASSGEPAKSDSDDLRGTWALVEWVYDGNSRSPLVIEVTRATFAGDRCRFWQDTEKGHFYDSHGLFTLDPSKAPKHVDFRFEDHGDRKPKKLLGIYELHGDTLKICTGGKSPDTRPVDFEAPHGSKSTLEVYKRIRQPPEREGEEP